LLARGPAELVALLERDGEHLLAQVASDLAALDLADEEAEDARAVLVVHAVERVRLDPRPGHQCRSSVSPVVHPRRSASHKRRRTPLTVMYSVFGWSVATNR